MNATAPSRPFVVEGNPEFAEAQRIIARSGHAVGKIHRVYEAGHPQAERDGDGVPRETIVYQTPALEPMVALVMGPGVVVVSEGW